MTEPPKKVFIESIKQIQNIIQEDNLKTGDKIPSERELSDRLNFGRSSVREALRALELLGLIETKRGEGTFVKDFGSHHLVELIGSFILQTGKVKNDLVETKKVIEEQAIVLAIARITKEQIADLRDLVESLPDNFEEEFLKQIFISTENRLLLKIWQLLSEYYLASVQQKREKNPDIFRNLLQALEEKDKNHALEQVKKLYE